MVGLGFVAGLGSSIFVQPHSCPSESSFILGTPQNHGDNCAVVSRRPRSAAFVNMSISSGLFTASKPSDRKIVPDVQDVRKCVKIVYVVLESQYQSTMSAAANKINTGSAPVSVEVSGYLLEELRDPANYEQLKQDLETANVFIASLILSKTLPKKSWRPCHPIGKG